MIVNQRITIIRTTRLVRENSVNEEIRWLCNSLGLFSLRDKDSSCYRVFIELLKNSKAHKPLSSDEIAYSLSLSRGTVMHHMNRLMDTGLVITDRNKYMLRVENLEVLVNELERDVSRAFQDIKAIAKKIDRELGL
ncbi:ArsR family transcriptional regulator [Candidatus Woesearchaeota archaeon]|nr:ArsR family transcriptional regulator [Candidatus Woesearchaeota archaeon]